MGQGESHFFPIHGHNIRLKDGGSLVERVTDSRNHSVVFTRRTLEMNCLFQVKIIKCQQKNKKIPLTSQMVIGITTQNPNEITDLNNAISLHDLQQGYNSSQFWCVEIAALSKTTKKIDSHRQYRDMRLKENDTIGLMITQSGYVHLFKNGMDKELIWNNLPSHQSLWGIVELNGNITAVKADNKIVSNMSLEKDGIERRRPLPPLPHTTPAEPYSLPIIAVKDSKTLPNLTPVKTHNEQGTRRRTLSKSRSEERLVDRGPESVTSLIQQRLNHLEEENVRLQLLQTQQQQEILRLEEEKNRYQEHCSDLEEQVAILRAQLLQSRRSPVATTPDPDHDISFWEVNHHELDIGDRVIGRGGWGEVREGTFRGHKVAVKQLYQEILSPHYVSLVRREISLMAKVRHPNLVLFIAAVIDQATGSPIIVIELLDTSLRKAYQEGQLNRLVSKLRIMRDVAAALNYLHLHREPIIHRDVSSANVLLEAIGGGEWKGKLSDFGSANMARLATTAAPGAEVYAAPEVPRSSIASSTNVPQLPSIDVYSYGILLCEVLAGQFPLRDAFPGMLQMVASTSLPMHRLTLSCIEQDPRRRPAMHDVLAQINRCLNEI